MAKREVRTHTFNRRKYQVEFDDVCDGVTDTHKCNRTMMIMADLATQNGLITCIHEALHASNWAATEKVVDRVSTDIGKFLWRLGYRRK